MWRKETIMTCKDCKYHIFEEIDKGYVCCNDQSEHIADWTEDDDTCEYFTPKETNNG